MEYKHTFFEHTDFTFHLDDNPTEKILMLQETNTPCVLYEYQWKDKCNKLL